VTHHHFKMDSLNTITKRVTQKFFMASTDMKDAYYSIPIETEHRFKWMKTYMSSHVYRMAYPVCKDSKNF